MRYLLHPPAVVRDVALLVARVLLGVIFMAHGWQKISTNGMTKTTAGFEKMGIPLPGVSAWFAALSELVGGALVVVGFLTPIAACCIVLTMLGAWWFVHKDGGVFAKEGGWELVGALGALALAVAGSGAGRFSVDGLLRGGRDDRALGERASYRAGATSARR